MSRSEMRAISKRHLFRTRRATSSVPPTCTVSRARTILTAPWDSGPCKAQVDLEHPMP